MRIDEASAGNIVRILGLSQEEAEMLVRRYPGKLSYVIASVYSVERKAVPGYTLEEFIDDEETEDREFVRGFIDRVEAFSKKFPHHVKKIIADRMGTDDANKYMASVWRKVSAGRDDKNSPDVIMSFTDGHYWKDLKGCRSSEEGDMMAHCGATASETGTLLSLRDADGRPHVTIEYEPEKKLITQVRGRANSLPQRRYWPHISTLAKKLGAMTQLNIPEFLPMRPAPDHEAPTPTEEGITETVQADPKNSLEDVRDSELYRRVARQVNDAVRQSVSFGRKAYLTDVLQKLGVGPDRLPVFAGVLVRFHQLGWVVLSRADLVSRMDAEKLGRASIEHMGATYNMVEPGDDPGPIEEAWGERSGGDRKKKKKDDPRAPDPGSVQRNVPREMVNLLTNPGNPQLRYTIWQIRKLPKGTQTARLLRYMEDKGWRRARFGDKEILYHGRSLKMLEPTVTGNNTVQDLYGNFRPRGPDDVLDNREMDAALLKLWGVDLAKDPVAQDLDMTPTVHERPSEDFIKFVTSRQNVETAERMADQLYQHTGIILEPLTGLLPKGEPADRGSVPRTQLPDGVDPEDIVVIAEGGRVYVVRARNFGEGVYHDSRSLLGQGQVRTDTRGSVGKLDRFIDKDRNDWDDLRKRYGMDKAPKRADPGPSQMVKTDRGISVPSAWLKKDTGGQATNDDHGSSVRVQGDGVLTKAVALARKEGRESIYLVGSGEKRITTVPATLEYSRGGVIDEPTRAAASVRKTGGLPVQPGRWSVQDLGRWLRMFERDTGARL